MAAELPDRPVRWLMIVCAILFLLDFVIDRHPKVPGEGFPAFHAIVGFVAFTLIVLGAKQLRRLIGRREDYYAPFAIDAESYPEEGLGIEAAAGYAPSSGKPPGSDGTGEAGSDPGPGERDA